jgi:hypothetical protein
MEESNSLACEVIRVTRPNTLLIRTLVAPIQSYATTYAVLAGVRCRPQAVREIIDWLEIHADFGRFELMVFDWMRDSYGRLLANICDRRTGDTLTAYLLQREAAIERGNHLESVMADLLNAQEPENL